MRGTEGILGKNLVCILPLSLVVCVTSGKEWLLRGLSLPIGEMGTIMVPASQSCCTKETS